MHVFFAKESMFDEKHWEAKSAVPDGYLDEVKAPRKSGRAVKPKRWFGEDSTPEKKKATKKKASHKKKTPKKAASKKKTPKKASSKKKTPRKEEPEEKKWSTPKRFRGVDEPDTPEEYRYLFHLEKKEEKESKTPPKRRKIEMKWPESGGGPKPEEGDYKRYDVDAIRARSKKRRDAHPVIKEDIDSKDKEKRHCREIMKSFCNVGHHRWGLRIDMNREPEYKRCRKLLAKKGKGYVACGKDKKGAVKFVSKNFPAFSGRKGNKYGPRAPNRRPPVKGKKRPRVEVVREGKLEMKMPSKKLTSCR
jgi:hypothetical protein